MQTVVYTRAGVVKTPLNTIEHNGACCVAIACGYITHDDKGDSV